MNSTAEKYSKVSRVVLLSARGFLCTRLRGEARSGRDPHPHTLVVSALAGRHTAKGLLGSPAQVLSDPISPSHTGLCPGTRPWKRKGCQGCQRGKTLLTRHPSTEPEIYCSSEHDWHHECHHPKP